MADNIQAWLADLELREFAEAFAENGVDLALLPDLNNDDLKDMGVGRVADRKKILKAIEAMTAAPAAPEGPVVPSPPSEMAHGTVPSGATFTTKRSWSLVDS